MTLLLTQRAIVLLFAGTWGGGAPKRAAPPAAHSLRLPLRPPGIGSLPLVLFLGIAMSITAFPVLARILEERNLQGTALGTTAILGAAVDAGWGGAVTESPL